MSALSDYSKNKIIRALFGNQTFTTIGDNIFVALFTAAANPAANLVTEVSGENYRRRKIAAGFWNKTLVGEAKNTINVDFGTANSAWGTIAYVGVYDALQGGNLLAYAALSVSRTVARGDPVMFLAGALIFGVTENDPTGAGGAGGAGGNYVPPNSIELGADILGIGVVEGYLEVGFMAGPM
jgi:hypothetical protein